MSGSRNITEIDSLYLGGNKKKQRSIKKIYTETVGAKGSILQHHTYCHLLNREKLCSMVHNSFLFVAFLRIERIKLFR